MFSVTGTRFVSLDQLMGIDLAKLCALAGSEIRPKGHVGWLSAENLSMRNQLRLYVRVTMGFFGEAGLFVRFRGLTNKK